MVGGRMGGRGVGRREEVKRILGKLDTVRGTFEEKSRPPLQMFVLRLAHLVKTTEIRSIELIHIVPIPHKVHNKFFSSSNMSIWVPKNAEFYADSKSEDKI